MIKKLGLACVLAAGSAAVQAQDLSAVDCSNTVTQLEMNACAEQDWMAADADLNAAYGAALAVMQDLDAALPRSARGAEANLRKAQRAWITYRDAACAAEGYAMRGGSAEPLLIYGCRARLTAERTQNLILLSNVL